MTPAWPVAIVIYSMSARDAGGGSASEVCLCPHVPCPAHRIQMPPPGYHGYRVSGGIRAQERFSSPLKVSRGKQRRGGQRENWPLSSSSLPSLVLSETAHGNSSQPATASQSASQPTAELCRNMCLQHVWSTCQAMIDSIKAFSQSCKGGGGF